MTPLSTTRATLLRAHPTEMGAWPSGSRALKENEEATQRRELLLDTQPSLNHFDGAASQPHCLTMNLDAQYTWALHLISLFNHDC